MGRPVYLDSTDRRPHTTADSLREPFASLVLATYIVATDNVSGRLSGPQDAADEATKHLGSLLALCLEGQSASKAALVDLITHYSNTSEQVRQSERVLDHSATHPKRAETGPIALDRSSPSRPSDQWPG
jgi:hypothetical protein